MSRQSLRPRQNTSKTGTTVGLKNNGFIIVVSSIMASDSPAYEQTADQYQPQPGRSTPPPTTSYSSLAQPRPEDSTAIEPKEDKEEEEKKDEADLSRPEDCKPEDHKAENSKQDGGRKGELGGRGGEKKDEKKDGREQKDGKMNGDVLDAEWVRPEGGQTEEKEENCAVNCIYYTMQCCECTIT